MAANAIAAQDAASVMSDLITKGDLQALSPEQKVTYYWATCESVGLNPLTKPFEYIRLSGKLVLYATKGATDQLRALHNITVRVVAQEVVDDVLVVTVEGTDATGRVDSEIGAVTVGGLRGDALANARMKALTKAKRRLTLSMTGLGMLDDTELETVPNHHEVRIDMETGEFIETGGRHVPTPPIESPAVPVVEPTPQRAISPAPTRAELIDRLDGMARERGLRWEQVQDLARQWVGKGSDTDWTRADWMDIEERLRPLPLRLEVAAIEENEA